MHSTMKNKNGTWYNPREINSFRYSSLSFSADYFIFICSPSLFVIETLRICVILIHRSFFFFFLILDEILINFDIRSNDKNYSRILINILIIRMEFVFSNFHDLTLVIETFREKFRWLVIRRYVQLKGRRK